MIFPGHDIALYDANFSNDSQAYIASLPDATVCEITEERNGAYELYMEYPSAGAWAESIAVGCVVTAPTSEPNSSNDLRTIQPFRVYKIERELSGVTTVWAEHISYQLGSIPVTPFTALNVGDALSGMVTHSVGANPFTVSTDKTTAATFAPKVPAPFRSLLGGMEGSILDVFGGGEYKFNWYSVSLLSSRGTDRGFTIQYADNMTGLSAEADASGLFDGVCPFWSGEDGTTVTIPEGAVWGSSGLFPYRRTVVVDFTGDFETAPTEAQLRARATAYLGANGASAIPQSITVDMRNPVMDQDASVLEGVPPTLTLDGNGEIVSAAVPKQLHETLRLCDTVTVVHPGLGISVQAKVVRTVWDCLAGRYKEITIGSMRTTLADTIVGMENGLTDAQAQLAHSYLPLTGGDISGDLSVSGTLSASNVRPISQYYLAAGGSVTVQIQANWDICILYAYNMAMTIKAGWMITYWDTTSTITPFFGTVASGFAIDKNAAGCQFDVSNNTASTVVLEAICGTFE